MPYNPIFNGFQATAEEIPAGDPLVAPPANLGPYTPWSIHVTMAGARLTDAGGHTLGGLLFHVAPTLKQRLHGAQGKVTTGTCFFGTA